MYRYYSTSRPVGIGTFPKKDDIEFRFTNFRDRQWCEDVQRSAWGYIEVDKPYTHDECEAYELVPSLKTFSIKVLLNPEHIQKLVDIAAENDGMTKEAALQYLANMSGNRLLEVLFQ